MTNKTQNVKKNLFLKKGDFSIVIPMNAKIYLVHSFAGKGSPCKFYNAKNKSNIYGGNMKQWSKNKGYVFIKHWVIELHWVHNDKVGNYEYKIKNYKKLQSKSFFYDFIEIEYQSLKKKYKYKIPYASNFKF